MRRVSKASRDEIKLAAIGSEILWILPNKKCLSQSDIGLRKYSQKISG